MYQPISNSVVQKLSVYAANRRDSEVMNRHSAFQYKFSLASLLGPFSKRPSHKANHKFVNLTSDLRVKPTRVTRHVYCLYSTANNRLPT